jgi:predicted phosphodiesterase
MITRRGFIKTLGAMGAGLAGWPLNLYGARQGLAQGQRYFIPPTLQHISENSATLYFRLAERTQNGRILVWLGDELAQEIPFSTPDDSVRVQMTLEDLQPASTYRYQILVDEAELPYLDSPTAWNELQFSTPPYEFPLRVGAIGDSGFGHASTYELGRQMASHEPDLFLHLGDVVYFMHEYENNHWVNWQQKYFLPFHTMLQQIPHLPTFGNHELDGPAFLDDIPSYYWMFPPLTETEQYNGSRMWYSVDINGIQFLSLNSQLFYSYPNLRQAQEDWLDAKLARTDVLYTVPFFHITPFTSSAPHQWDGIYVAEQWSPKFEAAKVPVVLCGHAHVYERSQHNGVPYITAGAGSDTLYGEGERIPQTVLMWRLTSYPILDFYPDRIELMAYSLDGSILDEARIPIT